jgi:hypothetical protein
LVTSSGYLEVPEGWIVLAQTGPAPFTTEVSMQRPDGAIVRWQSRRHRKQRNRLTADAGYTWWAPGAVAWWIAVLFMVGSACFALGSLPAYAGWVGAAADGTTFFVGSIFFTSAALLVYLEAVNSVRSLDETPSRVRLLSWEPARIDWWAGLIQLAGTLFFNRSTFQALQANLTASEANQMIWRPDALGSICFLVASALAWAEAGHGWVSWKPRDISWWIALLNLAGSVAFGISAIASKIVPTDDQPRSLAISNLGTFIGAICFLVGAFLLLPERTQGQQAETNGRKGRDHGIRPSA